MEVGEGAVGVDDGMEDITLSLTRSWYAHKDEDESVSITAGVNVLVRRKAEG